MILWAAAPHALSGLGVKPFKGRRYSSQSDRALASTGAVIRWKHKPNELHLGAFRVTLSLFPSMGLMTFDERP
jgi:hypothetical protein